MKKLFSRIEFEYKTAPQCCEEVPTSSKGEFCLNDFTSKDAFLEHVEAYKTELKNKHDCYIYLKVTKLDDYTDYLTGGSNWFTTAWDLYTIANAEKPSCTDIERGDYISWKNSYGLDISTTKAIGFREDNIHYSLTEFWHANPAEECKLEPIQTALKDHLLKENLSVTDLALHIQDKIIPRLGAKKVNKILNAKGSYTDLWLTEGKENTHLWLDDTPREMEFTRHSTDKDKFSCFYAIVTHPKLFGFASHIGEKETFEKLPRNKKIEMFTDKMLEHGLLP